MMGNVLITGGTAGIGRACVERFLDAGSRVTVLARHRGDLPELPGLTFIPVDLSAIEGIRSLPRPTGPVDVLINNAGVLNGLAYDAYDEAHRRRILALNLEAPVELMRWYGPLMAEAGGGRIVNVASHCAFNWHPDIWYAMTKAALVSATRSFAEILGGQGVAVNAVAPGPVATAMAEGPVYAGRFERIVRQTVSGRMCQAAEAAEVIFWLSGQAPAYLTGETIVLNNGAFSLPK